MAGLKHVLEAVQAIVGPVCKSRTLSLGEADVHRILHAYLLAKYASVTSEFTIDINGNTKRVDFRFGDKPHGMNPFLLELAVRNSEDGSQLTPGQNKSELSKLSKYSSSLSGQRILLLLDLGHQPLSEISTKNSYDQWELGKRDQYIRPVAIQYVHRDKHFRFTWWPKGRGAN